MLSRIGGEKAIIHDLLARLRKPIRTPRDVGTNSQENSFQPLDELLKQLGA